MHTATNKLVASAFVHSPKIRIVPWSSSPILWSSERSPEISFTVHKPAKTPGLRKPTSLAVLSIPRDSEIGDWRLKSVLLVQVSYGRRESLATTWLEGVAEYGTAKDENEAITDLIASLGEYRESLEKKGEDLGDSARKELDCLRRLIERLPVT